LLRQLLLHRGTCTSILVFYPFGLWVRSPYGTDRQTDTQTDRQDPYCGLLKQPHNSAQLLKALRAELEALFTIHWDIAQWQIARCSQFHY